MTSYPLTLKTTQGLLLISLTPSNNPLKPQVLKCDIVFQGWWSKRMLLQGRSTHFIHIQSGFEMILSPFIIYPPFYSIFHHLSNLHIQGVPKKDDTVFLPNISTTKCRIFKSFFFSRKLRSLSKFWTPYHFCAIWGGQDYYESKWGLQQRW